MNLNAAQILVTRPVGQADNLCGLIEQQGGVALRFPTLEIVEHRPEATVLAAASQSDWLIFTSTNAVDFAIKAFNGKMPALPKIAAVGKATAQALENAAWQVDCVPATEFSSEGLLAEAALQAVSNQNCFIVRGVGGRDKLEQGLRSRGAHVAYLEVYRRQQPKIDNRDLVKRIAEQQLDALTITSIEALQNLLTMLDSVSAKQLQTLLLVAASQRIAEAAEQLGFTQIAVSQQPTDLAILETLTTLFNGENSGRRN